MVLELSIVRIFKSGGGVAGSGFLVSNEYILTCAHVVAYCLDTPKKTAHIIMRQKEIPDEIIEVNFPIFEKGKIGEKLETKVTFWRPLNDQENIQDIAVLKLINSDLLPEDAKPINLIQIGNQSLKENEFEALGFPKKGSDGEWATGKLMGPIGRGLIQLEGTKQTGLRLESGFSGTAIWDKNLQGVVGMAVKADQERPEAKVAFMIPTDLILQVGDLATVCRVDGRIQGAIAILENYFEDYTTEIRYAYNLSLPEISIPLSSGKSLDEYPGSLNEMIQNLDDRTKENYSLLERFICFLLLHLEDLKKPSELCQKLTEWLEKYSQNIEDLKAVLRKEKALKNQENFQIKQPEPYLLVAAIEKSKGFILKAWLIENPQNYTPENPQGFHSFIDEENVLMNAKGTIVSNKNTSEFNQAKNLTELLQFFWADVSERYDFNLEKIAIFLPYKLIDRDIKPVDQYISDPNIPEYFQTLLGEQCEITLRFSERLRLSGNSNAELNKFNQKWRSLTSRQSARVIDIFHPSATSGNRKKFFRQIFADDVAAVRLTEVLQPEKRESVMEAFYYAGIPVALWMRPEAENIDCAEELQNICNACNSLSNLPKAIKAKRSEAWEQDIDRHIGNHLSLLWEDPDIVPPVNELRMLES
ncbi:peptidase S1 and S6, chymotrypsin/Hap [Trichodesmium erythraeum IMS101]|uniref:Peptidase S1 and S6, chymotrypsin/Hap n=1 Tax=Trichodesmium erythraeum (strain IMS101) TaxID=203124 RepID=Q114S9_TRIEI|nr:trypsin-like peptidase domain-containing protein [Trichodesmium erythraeum GBRTRLIN201]